MTLDLDSGVITLDRGIGRLFDLMKDGVILLGLDGRILEVNRGLHARLGYVREEMVGADFSGFVRASDAGCVVRAIANAALSAAGAGEFGLICRNGSVAYVRTRSALATMEGRDCIVAVCAETDGFESDPKGSHYDPLTQLPNRRVLLDRLRRSLDAAERSGRFGALLVLNLDNFKSINDIRGHATGDELLRQVARRLQSRLRGTDTAARTGGDEFVVILENLETEAGTAEAHAKTVGSALLAELARPYKFEGKEYQGSASIGIALFGGVADDANDLLKRADMAMHEAKKAGRSTLRVFERTMQAVIEQRAQISTGMRAALRLRQFVPYYQRLVDRHGRTLGAEVLVRWNDPARGLIAPDGFISVAEETGLIVPIGDSVLEDVCVQLKAWSASERARDLTLSVNVSSQEIRKKDFVAKVRRLLDVTGADPSLLVFEITETVLLDNIEDVAAKMKVLGDIGISFALDDFGTGYSSLSYLKRLPIHKIKIDRSFIADVTTHASDLAIVQAIIQMGRLLGLAVVAEGVETEPQRALLEKLGCDNFQGYLFGRPVPIETFEREIEVEGAAGRFRQPEARI